MIGDVTQMTKARHYADDDFVPVGIAAEIAHASASLMKKLRRAGEGPAYFKSEVAFGTKSEMCVLG